MAEINNFSEISENFDTIKTLLNSIRAQGILNTSDVDKLLSGINAKLEKINTDEDIDLIKIFLTELKQNLDERHSTLLSKFGAIESLFSNLLKNSSEMLKASEVKELFDIVATNLSVFSREVVSQKETLTDITLRLDAMRSDDTQKKEIIKNISLLKNDLDKLNNGFDSIVISLNENFKTLVKTISTIDQTEAINKFGTEISDVVNSSNTILSALQVLDKKNVQITETLEALATTEDVAATKRLIGELLIQNKDLSVSLEKLLAKSGKIDTLAEKIDASVSIIASLKTVISDVADDNTNSIINKIVNLEALLQEVSSNQEFENFKTSLEEVFHEISSSSLDLQKALASSSEDIQKIREGIKSLDLQTGFQSVKDEINQAGQEIKEQLSSTYDKLTQYAEVGVTRTLNEISASAETLNSRIKETNTEIAGLCEKNFTEVIQDIENLRAVISQIDENNVSANNAIFANITDRLAIFENNLKNSMEQQENYVSTSSSKLLEEFASLKDLSGVVDYKLDSSIIQISDAKKEYEELKNSVNSVLALDFVNVVKDLRVDLYASKQAIENSLETASSDLADKFSNDLFGKYELLISKLDTVEDNFKQVQKSSLNNLKPILDNISSSIMDVLSYVSEKNEANTEAIDTKLANMTEVVRDTSLNYIENVRDVVEVIKTQVENNLLQIEQETTNKISSVNSCIEQNSQSIKEEIKYSYNKLLEIQDSFRDIKELLNSNNDSLSSNAENLLSSATNLRTDFETKLASLKQALLESVSDFKQEFTCENADKISEIKFNSENLHSKLVQHSNDLKNDLRIEIEQIILKLKSNVDELAEQLASTVLKLEGANKEIVGYIKNDFCAEVDNSVDLLKTNITEFKNTMDDKVCEVVNGFNNLENAVTNLSAATNSSLASTLAKILENFVSLKSVIEHYNGKTADDLRENTDVLMTAFENLKLHFAQVDANIDDDLTRQLSLIETNFETLLSRVNTLFKEETEQLQGCINAGLTGMLGELESSMTSKLEQYKSDIENVFENIDTRNKEQVEFLKARAVEINEALHLSVNNQNTYAKEKLDEMLVSVERIVKENIDVNSVDYQALQEKMQEFSSVLEMNNKKLSETLQTQLDDVAKFLDSGFDIQAQEVNTKFEDISAAIVKSTNTFLDGGTKLKSQIDGIQNEIDELKENLNACATDNLTTILNKLGDISQVLSNKNDELAGSVLSNNAEIKTSIAENLSLVENSFDVKIAEIKELVNNSGTNLQTHVTEQIKQILTDIERAKSEINSLSDNLQEKFDNQIQNQAEASANELKSIEAYVNHILNQVDEVKQNSIACRDLTNALIKKEFEAITQDIEKETDIIVKDIIEQFNLFKDLQKDELTKLSAQLEGSIDDYIYNHINDLKSYLDVKTDNSVINTKIDNLKIDISRSLEDTLTNINKLIDINADSRAANEVLITSMTEKFNAQIQDFFAENKEFISENVAKKFEEKLNLFDKKFIDTVVDKYEEIKLISTQYNTSFDKIQESVGKVLDEFKEVKNELSGSIATLVENINKSMNALGKDFEDLKLQVLNKDFDKALQTSLNNQIQGIENLVNEQLGYLDDISELCGNNLPELTEMNTIIKYGVQQAISDLSNKLEQTDASIVDELNGLKSDIITQFINVFNQISFVSEQEEILDFIQEKHSELITILSHIVTTSDGIETVKDNVAVVDNKLDNLQEDINLINEKITAIMSSEGDIDYVYSLQDLESDIANLRIVLNEMKKSFDAKELGDEDFKKNFDELSEDILSISTRTNKLILATDESNQNLKESLQDFKLVINDLDERTRNFAHEAGLDKIDNKLISLNSMMQSGAKTNQVFNQIFEYLAEWVDKAGEQISHISDRVEALDDIGQVKVMLEDLKAEAADNSDSVELIEALSNVFDKQAKKISSLEAKLDRVIVETTINNKQYNKIDMTPFEDTLNRFLVAIDDKMISQQNKINLLETKLEEVMSLIDRKDTAQLTKKVGGMDRQIAKLNKSIEKIASHVVEK